MSDWQLSQVTVDFRSEERRAANQGPFQWRRDEGYDPDPEGLAQMHDEFCTLAIHVVDVHACSRELARCADDALTFTLRTLTEEGQITSDMDIGILDFESGSWLVSPYPASVFGRRT